ncbi:MAG: hypothetical protein AAGA10_17135, partial [Bacteroidota bacterium]
NILTIAYPTHPEPLAALASCVGEGAWGCTFGSTSNLHRLPKPKRLCRVSNNMLKIVYPTHPVLHNPLQRKPPGSERGLGMYIRFNQRPASTTQTQKPSLAWEGLCLQGRDSP